ncbi:hypothetical protein HB852_06285 [Listeria grandensis]|uniref:Uncharacterized protein n=1 Tax=Listeria grandensis TaxID=1494963 RepID=A0A7X1CQ23_9LIST|nr:hypothetical protein [Listeria grandensis]MBC1474218.1 hypothetical protein [Listeria grandensis]MBC1936593.1 hypothetical protein [Listeria grandensis]
MKKIVTVIGILIITIGGTLMYLSHMNYWPFQGDKVTGVPDGEIKNVRSQPSSDELSMLLAASGEVDYNVKAKTMDVYFDVYKRDTRVRHERVTAQAGEKAAQMNSRFVWGIPGSDMFAPSEIRVIMRNVQESYAQNTFVIPKGIFGKENGDSARTQPFEDGKIKMGEKYILQLWEFNKKYEAGDSNDPFSKEFLKEREQTVILYMVFN